jgi:hypothetical protein
MKTTAIRDVLLRPSTVLTLRRERNGQDVRRNSILSREHPALATWYAAAAFSVVSMV